MQVAITSTVMHTVQIKQPMGKAFDTIGPVVLLTIVWAVLVIHIMNTRLRTPSTTVVIDRGSYQLILGKDALSIFQHFNTFYMCGLSFNAGRDRIKEGGTYIDGLTNTVKGTTFIFLNVSSLQNNYSNGREYTCVMHETMHMAGEIFGGCWDSHEEQMVSWAEQEANEIIKILKSKHFIK